MVKRSLVLLLVFTMLFSVALTGCGNQTSTVDEPENQPVTTEGQQKIEQEGTAVTKADENANNPALDRDGSANTLVVGTPEAKGILNPIYYSSAYDGHVVKMIFRPLITRDIDGAWQPDLAKSWEISEDGLTYTFVLRDDIAFSDGEPVTAEDVAFTFKAIADPSYDGRYQSIVQDMEGFEAYFNGDENGFTGIKVVDETTIQFTFKEAIRTNISNFSTEILPEHYYGFTYGDIAPLKENMDKPMGCGPYVLETFEPKQFVKVTKNNDYYDAAQYKIENVVIKFVEDATDVEELISGNIDLLPAVIQPEEIAMIEEAGFADKYNYPRSGYGYLKFNCQSDRVSDFRVRQALQYAFDGQQFVQIMFEGLAVTQATPVSQVSWAYTDDIIDKLETYDYNPEKANELLDAAGWEIGADGIREKDGQKLMLRIPAMPDSTILEVLVPMLIEQYKAVGVGVEVSYMEFNSLLDKVFGNDGDFDMFFLATSINSPDPDSLYTSYHSRYIGQELNNTTRYANDRVDQLLDEGRRVLDPNEALPYYHEAMEILNEESPTIVVYANLYHDMVNSRIQGVRVHSLFDWVDSLKYMEIAQ